MPKWPGEQESTYIEGMWKPSSFAWAAISVVIDLPIFLAIFHLPLPDYAADIALTYLSFPLTTTGIAVAMNSARTQP